MAKKANRIVTIDNSNPSTGGGGQFRIPPGPYRVKCVAAEQQTSSKGNEMIKWEFIGVEGKAKNKRFYYYTVLDPKDVWKVTQTLNGLGIECPESVFKLDLDLVIDAEGTAIVYDEEYNDEMTSKIKRFEEADDTEEEEAPAKSAKARKKEAEEDEEDEPKKVAKGNGRKRLAKVSEDEVDGMDEDELTALVEKHELDVDLDTHKTVTRKRRAIVIELKERDLLEA